MLGAVGVRDASAGELRWLSIGDWGQPGDAQRGVVAEMAKHAQGTAHDFALLVGDNFYPTGVTSWEDSQFQTTYSDVFEAHPSLHFPHYAVLGNHDYVHSPEAQVERHYKVPNSYWRMPKRWYTQEFTLPGAKAEGNATALFIFIDTMILVAGNFWYRITDLEALRKEHWQWLQDTLENATADWIVLVGHHPVYSAGWHGNQPDLVGLLEPLLQHYGVDAYIAGHDHEQELLLTQGASSSPAYVVTGAGSKLRSWGWHGFHSELQFSASSYGFLSTCINASHLSLSFVSDAGELLHSHHQRIRSKRPSTRLPRVDAPPVSYAFMSIFTVLFFIVLICSCCCAVRWKCKQSSVQRLNRMSVDSSICLVERTNA